MEASQRPESKKKAKHEKLPQIDFFREFAIMRTVKTMTLTTSHEFSKSSDKFIKNSCFEKNTNMSNFKCGESFRPITKVISLNIDATLVCGGKKRRTFVKITQEKFENVNP